MRHTDLLWQARTDGQWDVFEPGDEHLLPPPPPPAPPSRLISVQEFRSRFTDLEQAATVTSANAGVKVLVFKLSTRLEPVNLDDQQVIAGVDLLIAQGILSPARKAAILA